MINCVLKMSVYRTADCDTDRYLVLAKVRERWTVYKQSSHRFHVERFSLKELHKVEGIERYHVEVSNRFAALEDLDAKVDNNNAWKTTQKCHLHLLKGNQSILTQQSEGAKS
jgi:hypothetical protein